MRIRGRFTMVHSEFISLKGMVSPLRFCQWQPYLYLQPSPNTVLCPDPAVVRLYHPLADGEPQPGPTCSLGNRDAVEFVEAPCLVLLRDTGAAVRNLQHQPRSLCPGGNLDLA